MSDNFRFLIVGAGRGGTSLLAALLDYHSQLEVGFEQHAESCLMGKALPPGVPITFEGRVGAFMAACHADADRYAGRIWGNKITTEQVLSLETAPPPASAGSFDVLNALFNQHLRDQAVVFILRDGRACVNSKVRRTGQPMEIACRKWLYSVECYQFFKTRHPRSLCVKFEDLLAAPESTLRSTCELLGIPYEPGMLEGVANEKMLPDYRSATIDRSKRAPADLPEPHLESIRAGLIECGYL
ncbi:MAG: sulfotransferase [Vicinamibacterales bacterium]